MSRFSDRMKPCSRYGIRTTMDSLMPSSCSQGWSFLRRVSSRRRLDSCSTYSISMNWTLYRSSIWSSWFCRVLVPHLRSCRWTPRWVRRRSRSSWIIILRRIRASTSVRCWSGAWRLTRYVSSSISSRRYKFNKNNQGTTRTQTGGSAVDRPKENQYPTGGVE